MEISIARPAGGATPAVRRSSATTATNATPPPSSRNSPVPSARRVSSGTNGSDTTWSTLTAPRRIVGDGRALLLLLREADLARPIHWIRFYKVERPPIASLRPPPFLARDPISSIFWEYFLPIYILYICILLILFSLYSTLPLNVLLDQQGFYSSRHARLLLTLVLHGSVLWTSVCLCVFLHIHLPVR